MLETRHSSSNHTIKPSLAFVPRQVSLLAKTTIMKKNEKAASQTVKKAEAIEDEALNMKSSKKEKKEKKKKKSEKENSDDLSPLLLSIAAFLKQHGYTKTLAALQSEASIEELGRSNVYTIDMESYYKILGASQYDGKTNPKDPEELDCDKDGIAKEKDKKKRKNKSLDADQDGAEILVVKQKEKSTHSVSSQGECKDSSIMPLEETDIKSRDSEKKKRKAKSDSSDMDTEVGNTENGSDDIHADGKHVKSKDKKRKNKLSTESSGAGEDMGKNNVEKENVPTMEETAVKLERKSSKKRKKLASENEEVETDEKLRTKETKQGKIEGSQEEMENANANALAQSEHAAVKRRKTEKGDVSVNYKEIAPGKQLNGLSNGNLQNNGTVGLAAKRGTMKQQKGSAEPKTVNAFQRVKVDEVKFANERLQDNSYWAKDGAEIGYGAKAQEILGQVKGRDFRHEKTKKKRGNYRGGQIDLQTHSIKFHYSDEE